jgi:hypothetical protein
MISKIKNLFATILAFTTGLGYYGLGLLAGGILASLFGWSFIGSGLIGAFIYKNYAAVVAHIKSLF